MKSKLLDGELFQLELMQFTVQISYLPEQYDS